LTTPSPDGQTSESLEAKAPDQANAGGVPQAARESLQPSAAPEPFATPKRRLFAALIVCLFFLAFLLGRVVAPALLGWRTGIEPWIRQADAAAAVLGQLALIWGVMFIVEYLYVAVRSSELNIGFRLAIAPLGAGIVTLSLAAGVRDLPLLLVVVLVLLVTLLATSASIVMLTSAHTRAAGAVLGASAFAAFLELTARVLAVRASQDALTGMFKAAQILTTISFVIEILTLGLAAAWLASRRWIALGLIVAGIWITSGFLARSAIVGSSYGASQWQVLISRSVNELARNPWPLVPSWFYFTLEITALLAVPFVLLGRRAQPVCRAAVALAISCRGDADLPIVALALALAALFGSVATAREVPQITDVGITPTT
jgi:hypothetical protein